MPVPPTGIDATRPNIARVYNYLLGGKDNFAADRKLADQLLGISPCIRQWVQDNRGFLCTAAARAARDGGIDQFLDLGAGLPASPAVHEAVRAVNPAARLAYVDIDPMAVRHAQVSLAGSNGLVSVRADLTDPEAVLAHPDTARVIDLGRPVAIIMGGVAHFFSAPQMRDVTARYLSRLRPGSWLVLSSGSTESDEMDTELKPVYTASQTFRHSLADFASFFHGADMVPPGIAEARLWVKGRHAPPPRDGLYVQCGVGVKRA